MKSQSFILKCWGPLACFSRPDGGKVERLSYPVPTPSVVRGIFSAIYSKPLEFWWQPVKVEVLKPIQYIALRRNEVKDKISVSALQKGIPNGSVSPLVADGDRALLGTDKKGRTQRQTMALKDVAYRFHARIVPQSAFENRLHGLEAQFVRRAAKGKCFYQPAFGCKEFVTYFELVADIDAALAVEPPVQDLTQDMGMMVYDTFDLSVQNPPGTGASFISLFKATLKNGVMDIPPFESDLVIKPERRK